MLTSCCEEWVVACKLEHPNPQRHGGLHQLAEALCAVGAARVCEAAPLHRRRVSQACSWRQTLRHGQHPGCLLGNFHYQPQPKVAQAGRPHRHPTPVDACAALEPVTALCAGCDVWLYIQRPLHQQLAGKHCVVAHNIRRACSKELGRMSTSVWGTDLVTAYSCRCTAAALGDWPDSELHFTCYWLGHYSACEPDGIHMLQ